MTSDTPEIRPALGDHEWDWATKYGVDHVRVESGPGFWTHRHAVAALCLHGQPFGFSWEDVEMLRGMVIGRDLDRLPGYGVPILNLADRIAALLPPREE